MRSGVLEKMDEVSGVSGKVGEWEGVYLYKYIYIYLFTTTLPPAPTHSHPAAGPG